MDFAKIPLKRSLLDALMSPLCIDLIALYLELSDWEMVRKIAIENNLAQKNVLSSRKRFITEALARVRTLSGNELHEFHTLNTDEKKLLLWIALCRSNLIVATFGFYLLHEGARLGKTSVSKSDYESFYMHLCDEHAEFKDQSDSYHKLLRRRIFSSARQAGLLAPRTQRIQKPFLSKRLLTLFSKNQDLCLEVLPL